MATKDTNSGLARELGEAIDELHAALQQATDAAAHVQALVPRIGALGTLFDDIEAVLATGRQQIGVHEPSPTAYPRPTLVPEHPLPDAPAFVPEATIITEPAAVTKSAPAIAPVVMEPELEREPEPAPAPTIIDRNEALTCFRLEFESRPGPLDLRTVDDAVSEHPAVRDVALLDYDGRKATLKVWIVASASPADVQLALSGRAAQIFNNGNDVTIIALEDVA